MMEVVSLNKLCTIIIVIIIFIIICYHTMSGNYISIHEQIFLGYIKLQLFCGYTLSYT